jgi:penicillin-binding protein 1A
VSSKTTNPKKEAKKQPNSPGSFLKGVMRSTGGTVLGIAMITSSIVAGGLVGLAISFRNLPDVRVLRHYLPSETSYIYDVKGKMLASLHGEAHREVVALDQVSPDLKRAVVAIEDSHFYQHHGVNLYSMGRASVANFNKGGVSQGASTLTMQLIKNIFLSRDRTITRKLAEVILAIRLEEVFDKNEIMEMYLNNIYWGHNNYGVQTASQSFFNKPASKLNLAEAAAMAGMIQAPEQYSPFINLQETKRRQGLVLSRMEELGWITQEQKTAALNTPLKLGKPSAWEGSKSPFVTEAVLRELYQKFGRDKVIQGGMRIQTTIDADFQKMAEKTVSNGYQNLRRSGVRADQVALVAVDPRTHFVKALVGGIDYKQSQFNRATQARRQPGSSFKPFVYYAAFASGKFTPYSTVIDAPSTFRVPGGYYSPKNYGGNYAGAMSIRTAILKSQNVPAVKIGRAVGMEKVIEICRSLGIKSPLIPVISLPLGSMGVTPLEMAGAFATFASNGWHSEPTTILQVTDTRGNVLLDNRPKPQLILNPWATASLTSVLKGVIDGGTGKNAAIGRPAAGKTGTTSSERDVWFVGYTPQLATAVWVGNDNYRSLGRGVTGGSYAAPIWRTFMFKALEKEPVMQFASPSNFTRPRP